MELWVRSQDKEALLKVNNGVMYWETTDKKNCIVIKETSTNLSILGEYKTKERALEVLDEINMFINTRAVQVLNDDAELSSSAMVFVLQSIVSAVDKAQDKLDKDKDL